MLSEKQGGIPEDFEYRIEIVCNGLLAATSMLMDDFEKLTDGLEIPRPDWNEIKSNLPCESDLRDLINRPLPLSAD